MAKVVMTEKKIDPLLQDLGKAKTVDHYDVGKSRIINNDLSKLKVTFIDKAVRETGVLSSEVTTLKLEPIQSGDFRTLINRAITLNVGFTNHFVKLDKPEKTTMLEAKNLNAAMATYDISTAFNYISQEYDLLQTTVSDIQLPSILSFKAKRDFVDFKRQRNPPPLNFSLDASKFENFVLPNCGPAAKGDLNSSNVKEQFPYYNEIKITNKVSNKFTNFINEIEIFDHILNAYLKSKKSLLGFNVQVGTTVGTKKIGSFDLLSWTEAKTDAIPDNMLPLIPQSSKDSAMIVDYKKLLFGGYVRSLSQGNFRSFEEIYNNEQCYKEDFVYSVDKYNEVMVEPKAQTIYIPAVDDTSIFNDTQVKYGQKYIYKCSAHYIIVGNKYHYSNLKFFKDGDNEYATVEVTNVPNVVIVPFDMFTESVMTLMSPPLFPQVKFVTQNNSSDKIQIYLSPTKGEKIDPFIPILPSDVKQSLDMSLNSMNRSKGIRFKFAPQSGLFEIFKTMEPPESYGDFKDKKLANIRMSFESNSAIFNDLVNPNTTYYYLFRQQNVKGLVSNPSAIYKVELLKDADDSKIVVEEYDFPRLILKQETRKFKSLFQIYPAQDQTWFDEQQQALWDKSTLRGTIDNLSLGITNKSVWGRKFKIRVKSTTSGKIIDYNITFKLTKNKTEEDF